MAPIRWMPLALVACSYPALQPEDVCAEVAHAVALRTLECTGDPELANERGQIMADGQCLASGVHEELWQCPRTLYAATCEQVEADGDEPNFWIGLDPICTSVLDHGGGEAFEPIEPFDGVGSCGDPWITNLQGQSNSSSWIIDDTYGASWEASCLGGQITRDHAVRISFDDSGVPLSLWVAADGVSGTAVSILQGGRTCAESTLLTCTTVPDNGGWMEVASGQGGGTLFEAIVVFHVPDPSTEVTSRIGMHPTGQGEPY